MAETTLWERNKGVRRKAILAAARKIILENGVDGLSMRGLAARANVSVRTIYNLIGKQNDVLSAIVGEMVEVMLDAVAKVPPSSPIERAEMSIMEPIRLNTSNPRLFRPALRVIDETPSYDTHQVFEPQSVAAMEAEIQSAVNAGLLRADAPVRMLAQIVFAVGVRSTMDWSKELIDDGEYWRRALSSLYVVLASVALEPTRTDVLARLSALLAEAEGPAQPVRSRGRRRYVAGHKRVRPEID